MLCFHFHSSQSLISPAIYSLTHWLLWNVLFNLHIFLNFPYFLLLLISFWSVNVFHMISILFSLLRLVLWPSIWYILENILYTLQKNVYFIVGWSCLQISVRSIVFFWLFKSSVSLIFLSDYFIHYWKWDIEVPNYYCWIVCFFPKFCTFLLHIFLVPVIKCIYVSYTIIYSWWIDHFIIIKYPFQSLLTFFFGLNVYFVWY